MKGKMYDSNYYSYPSIPRSEGLFTIKEDKLQGNRLAL